jgi:hypothetical protein
MASQAMISKTANEITVSVNRPWIWPEVSINGPIHFDDQGAHINLLVTYHNEGHVPALAVMDFIEAYPWMTKDDSFEKDPAAERAKWCSQWATFPLEGDATAGQAVFPGQTFKIAEGTVIPRRFIRNARDVILPGTPIIIQVVGCINYRFAGDSSIHHTGFMKQLYLLDPDGNIYVHRRIPIDQGDVDAGRLGLADTGSGPAD